MIRILKNTQADEAAIFRRSVPPADVSGTVRAIIADVRARGDAALLEYTRRFDGAELTSLAVSEQELDAAMEQVRPELLEILKTAAGNIRTFHEKQKRPGFILTEKPGVVLGQRVLPIDRVGLYVPGGTAAYPSTVLMDSIPARIAGCREIVITTPARRDGTVPPALLAAARIAGVDRIFKVGGAQAVAALAYGTETIPAVDKIVGPGNAFVAEAKRQVFGQVSIDMIAGPSEILIVSDEKSDARVLAADLLSQAEHDKLASAVLITTSEKLAADVQRELERQIPLLERREIARASIDDNGKIILVPSIEEAIALSNSLAPEHLELCVDEPFRWLESVKSAGSVFLGRSAPEALGDYLAGPNHTLPTGGTARFSSPLSVDDFVKKSQFTYYSADAFRAVAESVAGFAEEEGLGAHAQSARIRTEVET